jgi:hypothetical protein
MLTHGQWQRVRADSIDALMLAACGDYDRGREVLDRALSRAESSGAPEAPALTQAYRKSFVAYVDLFRPGGLLDEILALTGEGRVADVVMRLLVRGSDSPP